MTSRTKPSRRDSIVYELTVAKERISATGRAAVRPRRLVDGPGARSRAQPPPSAASLGHRRFARLRKSGLLGAQRRRQAPLDLPQLLPLVDLQPEHVLDVEHVDHPLAIGADVGADDHHAEVLQALGEVVQQARAGRGR